MHLPISAEDAIVKDVAEIGVLWPIIGKTFFMRRSRSAVEAQVQQEKNGVVEQSAQGQKVLQHDVLVRLPSLRETEWRITVLQRWIGRVESVKGDRFLAIVTDGTNRQNPPEQVEVEILEVSESDRPLLCEGATFYWSIGYRDTPGGQRERISSFRFARQPRLGNTEVNKIFEQADQLATFLEGE